MQPEKIIRQINANNAVRVKFARDIATSGGHATDDNGSVRIVRPQAKYQRLDGSHFAYRNCMYPDAVAERILGILAAALADILPVAALT